jgi:hypothetical protein
VCVSDDRDLLPRRAELAASFAFVFRRLPASRRASNVASGLVTLVLGDQQAQCPVSTHFAQPGPVTCGEGILDDKPSQP